MREIDKSEMLNVDGGANIILIVSVITAIVSFITGALHGYSNPKECKVGGK